MTPLETLAAIAVIAVLIVVIVKVVGEALGRFMDWSLDVEEADPWQ